MARTKVKAPVLFCGPGPFAFEDVQRRLEAGGREPKAELLRSAFDFAAERHGEQRRRSGEPFLTHPVQVAYLLAELRSDPVCIAVGFLHDILEDTATTREEILERFGEEIANLVQAVTKIGRHAYVRRDQAQAESFRNMILASVGDIRVIIVKLADRLHNMATLGAMSREHRRRISRETLEIYAPIAHRLGMAKVRGDLEDLSFYYLYPRQYAELYRKLEEKLAGGRKLTESIRSRLEDRLREAGIEAEISYRVKRHYSIYRKLRRRGIDISQLFDYLAFRIVTESLRDSYTGLGVVHQCWRPIPGRFKDYIAMPKPNLYQSLHTTLIGRGGHPFEIQIRTREMDRVAEEGIAAHWRYKEGEALPREADQNIVWLRQLVEWQKDVTDARTFLNTLRIDLYPDEVYVFTPRGDVRSFPRGATLVDFAYRIHTDLGHHCTGARINGRLVPLGTRLANGDIVEILSDPEGGHPEQEWLSFVVTSRAKSKIRHWLNNEQRKRAVEIGRRILERELERRGKVPRKVLDGAPLEALLADEGLGSLEELYRRIGFDRIPVHGILRRVLTEEELASREDEPRAGGFRKAVRRLLPFATRAIVVRGRGDHLAHLAQCCRPLPGDRIVGYLTRGHGVAVHSTDCPNVRNLLYNPEREVEVAWAKQKDAVFPVGLEVETRDELGALARITDVIASEKANIRQIEAATETTGEGKVELVLEVSGRRQLERILRGLEALEAVERVERKMSGVGRASEAR